MKTKKVKFDISLKVGDEVEWSSQAGGFEQKKRGKVVAVVPPGIRPYNLLASMDLRNRNTHAIDPRTMHRDAESYIIEVPGKGKSVAKLYWPLISRLELVK